MTDQYSYTAFILLIMDFECLSILEKTVLFKDDANRDGHTSCSTLTWSNGKGGIILFAGFGNGTLSSFAFRHDGMHPVSKLNLGSPVRQRISNALLWYF